MGWKIALAAWAIVVAVLLGMNTWIDYNMMETGPGGERMSAQWVHDSLVNLSIDELKATEEQENKRLDAIERHLCDLVDGPVPCAMARR
jgi:hypothetical protein